MSFVLSFSGFFIPSLSSLVSSFSAGRTTTLSGQSVEGLAKCLCKNLGGLSDIRKLKEWQQQTCHVIFRTVRLQFFSPFKAVLLRMNT